MVFETWGREESSEGVSEDVIVCNRPLVITRVTAGYVCHLRTKTVHVINDVECVKRINENFIDHVQKWRLLFTVN